MLSICLIISVVFKIFSTAILLAVSVTYLNGVERKIIGVLQKLIIPDSDRFICLVQAFVDNLKLFVKKTTLQNNSNIIIFLLVPVILFLLSLIGWAVLPLPYKSALANYILILHFDLPTVYKFESILDQIYNICGHLGTEELNSSSLVEDSDLRDPTKLEEKNQDLLDKKVLEEEKYQEMVKQLLKKNNPDLLVTEELVTKYLELLDKEIRKVENEYLSVLLFYSSAVFIVGLKWYFYY